MLFQRQQIATTPSAWMVCNMFVSDRQATKWKNTHFLQSHNSWICIPFQWWSCKLCVFANKSSAKAIREKSFGCFCWWWCRCVLLLFLLLFAPKCTPKTITHRKQAKHLQHCAVCTGSFCLTESSALFFLFFCLILSLVLSVLIANAQSISSELESVWVLVLVWRLWNREKKKEWIQKQKTINAQGKTTQQMRFAFLSKWMLEWKKESEKESETESETDTLGKDMPLHLQCHSTSVCH